MQRTLTLAAFAALCTLALTCKKEPPVKPEVPERVKLTVIDVAVKEAYIHIAVTSPASNETLALRRNGTTVMTFPAVADTNIADTALAQTTTYQYTARLTTNSVTTGTSNTIAVQTLAPTSHNFTWHMDTLGTHSSVLYDVAIINDTLAYAVGEIFHRDSSENWTFFNLAKWNGREWTLQRVYWQGNIQHLRWIFAFSENDVWVNPILRWNGAHWQQLPFDPIFSGVTTTKAWGTSSRDFYVVGDGGFIAHYNGTTWRRLESGTTLDVRDIWGATNRRTGELEILALASTYTPQLQGSMVFRIMGNSAAPVSTTGLSPDLFSMWFVAGRRYYAVGAGIHQKRMLSDSAWSAYPPGVVTRFFSGGVRGQEINDVFVVGSFGEVVHYNGKSWFRYFSDVPLPTGAYGGISVRDHLIMTVGLLGAGTGTRGIILIGRR